MGTINFEDFKKLEIRIGKIVAVEKIESSNKLLKLQVDFGPQRGTTQNLTQNNAEKREVRQILAGIAKFYTPEQLMGKLCPFAFNLAPKLMGDIESQGMMLCADGGEGGPMLLHPDKDITPGSVIK
ncbi:MAG: hypothetical protein A3C50_03040 [Candidatus Staskawiczbacteria bacterium RIFCSPHIGHO2_02_FULL_43_16]|uniref:tRNA-binding domain-containing protein n=1 Tax=Candidatus Staskawiczbacteria bacterium RIFCSPHIGHO2_01_FULL_41_41 TaxID=1802203 RepID=A0A1G2HU31_9BACT|nr:MAG: hypothetical protein A2822_02910 [Candidatus Staskawiczbacteria bacterium RIFCSPHIGHO2_01_FULL_41_41]OGZ68679.1 MAG: hypothetical protein A3C50_03040 [Candidatus Staskawiczbacteria bacterium RIFCSPHIGHO2_02_FULL_43_16]OGZ75142.1 MAG: hypothetical protein A3A12_00970 [Candidatus Staskawiczbacteria bacterium RIFCSPLOWO2_01_FULL_43_17b]